MKPINPKHIRIKRQKRGMCDEDLYSALKLAQMHIESEHYPIKQAYRLAKKAKLIKREILNDRKSK